MLKQDYYLENTDSDHIMIIEQTQISSDTDSGNHLKSQGDRESLLERRIVGDRRFSVEVFKMELKHCLTNIISPTDANRKIENFIFKASTDPYIVALKIDAQYTGIICMMLSRHFAKKPE